MLLLIAIPARRRTSKTASKLKFNFCLKWPFLCLTKVLSDQRSAWDLTKGPRLFGKNSLIKKISRATLWHLFAVDIHDFWPHNSEIYSHAQWERLRFSCNIPSHIPPWWFESIPAASVNQMKEAVISDTLIHQKSFQSILRKSNSKLNFYLYRAPNCFNQCQVWIFQLTYLRKPNFVH